MVEACGRGQRSVDVWGETRGWERCKRADADNNGGNVPGSTQKKGQAWCPTLQKRIRNACMVIGVWALGSAGAGCMKAGWVRVERDTYPSVVSAGRDLLSGCVETTRLSHLEKPAVVGEEDEDEAVCQRRLRWKDEYRDKVSPGLAICEEATTNATAVQDSRETGVAARST